MVNERLTGAQASWHFEHNAPYLWDLAIENNFEFERQEARDRFTATQDFAQLTREISKLATGNNMVTTSARVIVVFSTDGKVNPE